MKIVYIVEGVNCAFDRAVYDTADAALADLMVDYADSIKIVAETRMKGFIADVGNGSIVSVTPLRLLDKPNLPKSVV